MRYAVRAIVVSSGVVLLAITAPEPPVAPVVPHSETRHGTEVTDNYYWLREKSNPAVTAYLKAENAYTEAMTAPLKPFEDALYKEMLGHIRQTDLSVPVRRGPYLNTHALRKESSIRSIAAGRAKAWPRKSSSIRISSAQVRSSLRSRRRC